MVKGTAIVTGVPPGGVAESRRLIAPGVTTGGVPVVTAFSARRFGVLGAGFVTVNVELVVEPVMTGDPGPTIAL
jgi:hypothetical protein